MKKNYNQPLLEVREWAVTVNICASSPEYEESIFGGLEIVGGGGSTGFGGE